MRVFDAISLMGQPLRIPESIDTIRAGYPPNLLSSFKSFSNTLNVPTHLAAQLPKRYDPICKQNIHVVRMLWRRFLTSLHTIPSLKHKSLADIEASYVQNQLTAHFPATVDRKKFKTIEDYWIFSHTHELVPPMDIRPVPEKGGWGLFAAADIAPFSYLGIYAGDVTPQHWGKEAKEPSLTDASPLLPPNGYVLQIDGTDLYIDAQTNGNHTRFINCHHVSEDMGPYSPELLAELVTTGAINCMVLFTNLKQEFNGYYWSCYRIRKDEELLIWYGPDHQQLYA